MNYRPLDSPSTKLELLHISSTPSLHHPTLVPLLGWISLLRRHSVGRDRILRNSSITITRATSLYTIGIHARCVCRSDARAALITALEVDVFDIEGVNVAWEVAKNCETDVDAQVGSASCYKEDTDWRNEDGDDNEEDC